MFGSHFEAIMKSVKPKLFIMGSEDEFTSTKQLESRVKDMKCARAEILANVNHFGLESTVYAEQVSDSIIKFIRMVETG